MHIFAHKRRVLECLWQRLLFILAPNWNLFKCLPTVAWINILRYSHTMENYTPMRVNELQLHAAIRMNLRDIQLSKGSQTHNVHTV